MSNGARHGLGVVIGLVVMPVTMLCLLYGTDQLRRSAGVAAARFQNYHGGELWLGMAGFLVAAVLIGVVASSRVSPLASLVPGAVFTLLGLIWLVAPRRAISHLELEVLPNGLRLGHMTLGPTGVFFLLGTVLVVASLAPSRWKGRTPAVAAPGYAPPPAPMGPPMHGAPAPMGAPQAPPAPGQNPPWQSPSSEGAPQYGRPPAGNPPPLPATPEPPAPVAEDQPKPSAGSGGPDDDEPGEWTRAYGGNRPN